MQTLQQGSLLQGGRYKILSTLGQGGFGITYLALQSGLERKVAIKEFFMKDLCNRDEATSHVSVGSTGSVDMVERFKAKFLKEARNMARLNHPNIVRIHDIFEENGTAYYVMEYAEGGSLADKVKRLGFVPESDAVRYIRQIADALGYIHMQKMNHLDVKPANIMLSEADDAILIDFGLSKQYDATTGNQTSTTPVGISDGYAPMEQYRPGGVGEFSPETDIYSLGATLFKLLTGTTPPTALDVYEEGVPTKELENRKINQQIIDIICKAMEGRKKDRIKDVDVFIEGLSGYDKQSPHVLPQPQTDVKEDEVTVVLEAEVRTFNVNGVSFDMMPVAGGTFRMGATKFTDLDADYIESPLHDVTLSDFYIGKTEVTRALWHVVMGAYPSNYSGDNHPMSWVSWNDCQEFIKKLNEKTGNSFRLPTEAEWEYAARGGSKSRGYKYSGGDNINAVAWYVDNSNFKSHSVATKRANELGIYDMSGNVLEWCNDWYEAYRGNAQTNPKGPTGGDYRVIRGGSHTYSAEGCRVADRRYRKPEHRSDIVGFRLALPVK